MLVESYVIVFLGSLMSQVPVIALATVGLVVALRKRAEMEQAFLLAAWGFSLLIIHGFVSAAVHITTIGISRAARIPNGTATIVEPNLIGLLLRLATYAIFFVALICLARAVFVGRRSTGREQDISHDIDSSG